jgi:hypothetical protein
MMIGSVLGVGIFFGLRLPAFPRIDSYLEGLRGKYKLLWLSLHQNGNDQLGYAVAAGLVFALISLLRRPHPSAQAFLAARMGLMLALAPVPGFCRLLWYNAPQEIIDVISYAYFLRFVPVTAPFALVAIFLALGRNSSGRADRWAVLALIGFVPWATWEHSVVLRRSWQFRESTAQTKKHLIAAVMDTGIDHLGQVKSLGKKANAAVYLAQPALAVDVVTVLGTIPIRGGPVNDFDDFRPLGINKLQQLFAYALIALWRDVVLGTRRDRWQTTIIVVIAIRLFDECFVHSARSFGGFAALPV